MTITSSPLASGVERGTGARSARATDVKGKLDRRGARPTYLVPLLGYTAPPLTLNQRLHWAAEANIKKNLKWAAIGSISAAGVPKDLHQVDLILHWQPTTHRQRDVDNPMPTLKVIQDALVAKKVIRDDNSSIVLSARCVIEPVAKPGRMWLEVIA